MHACSFYEVIQLHCVLLSVEKLWSYKEHEIHAIDKLFMVIIVPEPVLELESKEITLVPVASFTVITVLHWPSLQVCCKFLTIQLLMIPSIIKTV